MLPKLRHHQRLVSQLTAEGLKGLSAQCSSLVAWILGNTVGQPLLATAHPCLLHAFKLASVSKQLALLAVLGA
jgi:hypothetical protein